MSIRILPVLAALPLLAACVPVPEPAPQPEVVAMVPLTVPPPSVLPPLASPLPTPMATPMATPGDRPFATATLGSPPPAADGVVPAAVAPPAPATPAAAGRLGTTVASLGSPTAGGLWLETALVDAPTQGRVEYNGKSVTVQLRPSGGEPGSGSQISLEAMRALGAPLTGLPELAVFAL